MWSNFFLSRALIWLYSLPLLFLIPGGCMQPLYQQTSLTEGGTPLALSLASIRLEPISDLLGHYLENQLRFNLNGSSLQATPLYSLSITFQERHRTTLIDTTLDMATAGTVVVDADYVLKRLSDDKIITKGTVFTAASYDRTNNHFSNIRASRDAEIRDAKALADQIFIRLAAALISPQTTP